MAHKFLEHFAHIYDKTSKPRSLTRLLLNPLPNLAPVTEVEEHIALAEPLDICAVFTPIVKVGSKVLFPSNSSKPLTLTIKRMSQNGHAVAFHPLSGTQLYINLMHVTVTN